MTQTQLEGGGTVPEWDLADRMTKALRVSDLGVQDIAARMGVTRETIGRWINGRNKPSRPALMVWASLTGVDLEWLETGEAASVTETASQVLPRLDSNQQPCDYPSSQVIDLGAERSKRRAVAA